MLAALDYAAKRHDRFFEGRDGWMKYGKRRDRLKRVIDLASNLQKSISNLDVITRHDLNIAISSNRMDALSSVLADLEWHTEEIQKTIPSGGRRPTNLAAKRWINEVADIYKSAFGEEATISGGGSGRKRDRGRFFRLLEFSIPIQFPRQGGLEYSTVRRILKERERSKQN